MSEEDAILTQYSQAPFDLGELQRMHQANPENLDVLNCIAFRYYTQDELDQALEYYQKILALDAKHPEAHYYVGNVQFRRRKLVAAMMSWKKVIAIDPQSKFAENARERIELALERVRGM